MDWTRHSIRIDQVTVWNIPLSAFPLKGRFVYAKDFGKEEHYSTIDQKMIEKQLRLIFEEYTPVAHVSQSGLNIDVTFFHPYGFQQYFEYINGIGRELKNKTFPSSFTINLWDTMDDDALWFGGCPEIASDEVELFKDSMTARLEQESCEFKFVSEFDPARRELIVVPIFMEKEDDRMTKMKTREIVVELARHSESITWKNEVHRLLVRSATP
ncbi:hypothetical protein PENTCL1PPCAC_13440, partial [Pristionchus entomophagus]